MSTSSYRSFWGKVKMNLQHDRLNTKKRLPAISSKKTGKNARKTKTRADQKSDTVMHSHCSDTSMHPDHRSTLNRIRRIQGQVSGIERMISEQRYCVDILIQFRAVASALKAIESTIFEEHVRGCVRSAMHSKKRSEIDAKVDELMELLFKR